MPVIFMAIRIQKVILQKIPNGKRLTIIYSFFPMLLIVLVEIGQCNQLSKIGFWKEAAQQKIKG